MTTKKKAPKKTTKPQFIKIPVAKFTPSAMRAYEDLAKISKQHERQMQALTKQMRAEAREYAKKLNDDVRAQVKGAPKGQIYPVYSAGYYYFPGDKLDVVYRIKGRSNYDTHYYNDAVAIRNEFLKQQATPKGSCNTFKADLAKLMKKHGIAKL